MSKETDRDKFKRLAEQRVTRALKQLRLIGNLSNKSNYAYNDADVRKIYRTLRTAIDDMKKRFDNQGESPSDQFKL